MADNRTEQATPRRRQKAQEQGQVLRSRDLVSALTLICAICVLAWRPQGLVDAWQTYFARVLDSAVRSEWLDQTPVLTWTSLAVVQCLWPVFAATFCVAVGATLMQGGLVISPAALSPKWERFNPGQNIKQLFTTSTLSRLLRSLLPTAVIFYLALKQMLDGAQTIFHATRLSSREAGVLVLGGCGLFPAEAKLRKIAPHDQTGSEAGTQGLGRESSSALSDSETEARDAP